MCECVCACVCACVCECVCALMCVCVGVPVHPVCVRVVCASLHHSCEEGRVGLGARCVRVCEVCVHPHRSGRRPVSPGPSQTPADCLQNKTNQSIINQSINQETVQ